MSLLALLLLIGCTTEGPLSGPPGAISKNTGPLSGKYSEADAGYLVMSLAARSGTSYDSYTIRFRKKDRSIDGAVWWGQQNQFDQRKLDIKDDSESGIVDVRRLPPGDYEIFNFLIYMNGGTVQKSWWSKDDFSIPFTVAPGRTTYVGELMAVKVMGRNIFGIPLPDGGYFVLSDKASRDLAIARHREPGLGEVTSAVANPSTVGNPLIRASIP